MSARADRRLLAERYPLLFTPTGGKHQKRPLKVGIVSDLIERGVADRDGFPLSAARIQAAVKSYMAGPRYARALALGGDRFDLDGNPSGYVSRRHQEQAQKLVEAFARDREGEAA